MNNERISSYCRNIRKNTNRIIQLPASLFRTSIDETKRSIKKNPYTFNKNCIKYHKIAFFCLGFLFFTLSIILSFWKTNWICNLYLMNGELVKYSLSFFSIALAFICFSCAVKIKAEKELILQLYNKARKRLRSLYWKEQLESEDINPQTKIQYCESLENIRYFKEEALQLVQHISLSKIYDNISKERLYNQVIRDLRGKLRRAISDFRT